MKDVVVSCIGIHPVVCTGDRTTQSRSLPPMLRSTRLRIGETGLDYYHPAPDGWEEGRDHQRQRDFLTRPLQMAVATGLKRGIHTRDVWRSSFQTRLAIYRLYADRVPRRFFTASSDRGERTARSSRSAASFPLAA